MNNDKIIKQLQNELEKQNINIKNFPILLLSSLFFVTNSFTAYYNEYYIYSFLFFILTITSLIVHSKVYKNYYTNIIDKVAVLSIVLYGGYMFFNKEHIKKWLSCFIIIVSFLMCVYLYIYGFIIKEYCFCNEKSIAEKWHFIMHAISSFGHHFIIYL